MPPADLPGEPLTSGFRFRPATPDLLLGAEARRRVDRVIEESRRARLRALADAHNAVIGGSDGR